MDEMVDVEKQIENFENQEVFAEGDDPINVNVRDDLVSRLRIL